MQLRDLLAKYAVRLPGSRRPVYITNSALLRQATGYSRQYCSEAWHGRIPMTRGLAMRLHAASRKTIPLEKLFAIEPHEWPAQKRQAIAASRERQKRRLQDIPLEPQGPEQETKEAIPG